MPLDPVTGTLVASGINAGSNVIGNMVNWLSNGQVNSANERLMDKQNQWAYRMWQKNNDYNSPSAQMERLRAAGVNPALALPMVLIIPLRPSLRLLMLLPCARVLLPRSRWI